MEIVPFPVRPVFRLLAGGLAAAAGWAAIMFARLSLELGSASLWFGIGLAFTALAFSCMAFVAGSIALTSGLPRALVGPDEDEDAPTGAA